jgi:catechol 2,3-dioxygenase-like lactoylglutathione lyase family enzyme
VFLWAAGGSKLRRMIDHIALVVKDYARAKAFYTRALAPLGYALIMEPRPNVGGFGKDGKPAFWIGEGSPSYWGNGHAAGAAPVHVAFIAQSRAAVNAFYEAAIAAGAKDFGAPGLRPLYHPGYYGAFVIDPDGNDVEAVTHIPE